MSFRSLVVAGLKWQALLIVGQQLLSLAVFTVLARLLQPSDFGLMGLTYIYFALAGFIADQAIGAAIVQTAKLERDHLDTGFWYSIAWALLLCGTTLVLANPLAALLGDPRLAPILRWSSLSLVLASGAWIQNALFTRDMDFRRPAIRSLVGQLSGGIVGISMAVSGWGVWALVGQHITGTAVGTILVAILSSYRPRLRFSLPHLRELLRFGIPLFVNWVVGRYLRTGGQDSRSGARYVVPGYFERFGTGLFPAAT
jgi:O-antigen/teichoic acid export membrane protein